MAPKIDKVWMGETGDMKSIRLDWSNDRHHEVVIRQPGDADAVKEALLILAQMVGRDPHLRA